MNHRSQFAGGLVTLLLLVFGSGITVAADEAVVSGLPVEFQPYRITVDLTPASATGECEEATAALRKALPLLVERSIGGRWTVAWSHHASDVEAETKPTAESNSAATPEDQTRPDQAVATALQRPVDTRFRIVVQALANRTVVTVQAEEPLWQHHSPLLTVETPDRRELPSLVLTAMMRLFRPQAVWERIDDERVRLRIQASGFHAPDPEFPLLNATEYFAPGVLHFQRDGSLRAVSQIPWTLLEFQTENDVRGIATVVSGLRQPLSSRPRGRIELRAVASRPQWATTSVMLTSQSTPPRALVAHDVLVRPHQSRPGDDAKADDEPTVQEQLLLSDRRGMVLLSQQSPSIAVWLTVMSGDQRLAEVPIVPGASEQLSLELKDDRLRLRAEGQLKLLQSDLVAVVAERSALMLTCRGAARKAAWADVDRYLDQLSKLPAASRFQERLTGIRVPAVALARQQKDTLTERRIQRLCDELEALIKLHLSNDKLQLLREEMAELKAAAAEK